MLLATYDSDLYKICLILHILCAIVGFGAVFLNGVYGQQIKSRMQSGRVAEAIGIYEANWQVSKIGEYVIYGVFIFGFITALLGDPFIKFSQTWLWLAMVIYILSLGLSHAVLLPSVKRMGVLMHEMAAGPPPAGGPPPQVAEMAELGKKIGVVGPILDLSVIVVLFLMVWKPGLQPDAVAPYDDRVHPVLGSFYDEVLRELIAAMGAALFFGNLYALLRRHKDADRISARTVERGRPGSPVRSPAKPSARRELAQAPVARTIGFLVLGFVVMIAGIASLSM